LVAGTSCVDFSSLKLAKKSSRIYQFFSKLGQTVVNGHLGEETLESVMQSMWGEIDQEGESAKTFFAIFNYIMQRRPKIVLLENVERAAWEVTAGTLFPSIGYRSKFLKLDSKNYLIPQTRKRGYLIAVDSELYGSGGADLLVATWVDLMAKAQFDRPAELHKFLLEPGDHHILEARYVEEKKMASNAMRESSAPMCDLRHSSARLDENLGDRNPYTRLDSRGNCKPRDDTWIAYMKNLGMRPLDLLDITALRLGQKNVDMAHKTMIVDISQNVDRIPAQKAVVPCITPKGMPFLVDQGRPVLGIEALALQGVDTASIVPSIETPSQLRDLAGNAMTVTVVGSAILNAIIAERDTQRRSKALGGDQKSYLARHSLPYALSYQNMMELSDKTTATEEVNFVECTEFSTTNSFGPQVEIQKVTELCQLGRRYCPCDGHRKRSRGKNLFQCSICDEIRCISCKGNPLHNFIEFQQVPNVIDTDELAKQLTEILPGRFKLQSRLDGLASEVYPRLLKGSATAFDLETVVNRLTNAVYYMKRVNAAEDVTVEYDSAESRAQMVVSQGSTTWLVFLKPSSPLAGDLRNESKLDLNQPVLVARLQRAEGSIFPEPQEWEVFIQQYIELKIQQQVTSSTTSKFKILVVTGSETVPESSVKSIEKEIDGTFDFSDCCGVAFGNIFARRQGRKSFLFLDPGRTTEPQDDTWVFAPKSRRLHPMEYRDTTVRLKLKESPLLPNAENVSRTKDISAECTGRWHPLCLSQNVHAIRVEKYPNHQASPEQVDGFGNPKVVAPVPPERLHFASNLDTIFQANESQFIPFLQLRLPLEDFDFKKIQLYRLADTGGSLFFDCNYSFSTIQPISYVTGLDDCFDISTGSASSGSSGFFSDNDCVSGLNSQRWLPVSPRHQRSALEMLSFAVNKISNSMMPQNLQNGLSLTWENPGHGCPDSAPPVPEVHHILGEDGKVSARLEDSSAIKKYEEAMGNRPKPLRVDLKLRVGNNPEFNGQFYNDGNGGEKFDCDMELFARILINPNALAHRAHGYLPKTTFSSGIRRDLKIAKLDFRLCLHQTTPSFKEVLSFDKLLETTTDARGLQCDDRHLHLQPPSFKTHKLRGDQLSSLAWMLERESGDAQFVEQEFEEALYPEIGLRLRGSASVINRSRGGVLAHDVGYGKTAVTLGLIDYQRERIGALSMKERKCWFQHGYHHVKGTLIAGPKHIVKQWASEAGKFLGKDTWKIHTIQSPGHISKSQIEKADIIIAGEDMFKLNSAYRNRLALAAGMPICHPTVSGQDLEVWYKHALRNLHRHFDIYNRLGPEKADEAVEETKESILAQWIKIKSGQASRSSELKPKPIKLAVASSHDEGDFRVNGGQAESDPRPRKSRKTKMQETAGQSFSRATDSGNEPKRKNARAVKPSAPVRPSDIFKIGSLLELYSFTRLVLDESSYENEGQDIFFENSMASSKWTLSATPQMADVGDICDIASLLNVHVARYEPAMPPYMPLIARYEKQLHLSHSEEIRQYRGIKSFAFAKDRYDKAAEFIHHFVRQNPTKPGSYKVTEVAVLARLGPLYMVLYSHLLQQLYESRWDFEAMNPDMRDVYASFMYFGEFKKLDRLSKPSRPATLTGEEKVTKEMKSKRCRAKGTTKTYMTAASDALLLRASLNLRDFHDYMIYIGAKIQTNDSYETIFKALEAIYENKIAHITYSLKACFDRMQFLAARCDKDHSHDPMAKTTRNEKLRQYRSLLDNLLRQLIEKDASKFGGLEIMGYVLESLVGSSGLGESTVDEQDWQPDKWAAAESSVNKHFVWDFYIPSDDDFGRFSQEELTLVHSHMLRIHAQTGQGLQSEGDRILPTPPEIQSEFSPIRLSLAETFWATSFSRAPPGVSKIVWYQCHTIGLRISHTDTAFTLARRVERHFEGHLSDEDYLFGITPRPKFPRYGTTCNVRSVVMDCSVEDLMRSYRGAQKGIKMLANTYRDLRSIRQSRCLLSRDCYSCECCGKTALSHTECFEIQNPITKILCIRCAQASQTASSATRPSKGITCNCCKKKMPDDLSQSHIFVTCGHVLCSACVCLFNDGSNTDHKCIVESCGCQNDNALIPGEQLLQVAGQGDHSLTGPSPKVAKIVETIQGLPKDDKVVLFAQDFQIKQQLESAIGAAGIEVVTLEGEDSAKDLEDFKANKLGKVLLLSQLASEASGSNITNANHVMFATPLRCDGTRYDMYMRQAKGRCVREGQTKDVFIYHFITEHTIEVDILEHRLKTKFFVDRSADRISLAASSQPLRATGIHAEDPTTAGN
jgi:site-specific DNA-cytosine methylase